MSQPSFALAPDFARDWGEPLRFEGMVGFLHPAAGPVGAVIVPHWGYEGLCFHPMTRALAAALARAGLPCLRYDPPGSGHSDDVAEEADLLALWTGSVARAAAALRARCGVRGVALIGFGLGAAAIAGAAREIEGQAIEGQAIEGLKIEGQEIERLAGVALLAPWLTGRRGLRELSAAGRLAADAMGLPADAGAPPGGLAVAGFPLFSAQRDSLSRIEIAPGALAASPATLIVARPEQAAACAALAEGIGAGRARVIAFEGYEKAAFDPSNFVMPAATLAAVADWTRALPAPAAAPAALPPAAPAPAVRARADGFAEEALRFGPGGRLFGVLATPQGRPRAAALLLNAGRNRCIGWARGDVAEARRLASAGVAALRFDIAGVGDSAPENGDEPLYDARRAADVVAALDLIEARFGPLSVALRGPCSGAFLGFAAAVQDARVKAAALINAQRYVWNPADDFDTVMRQPVHTVEISRRARDPRQIRRLLTGDIPARLALERLTTMLARAAQARLGRAGLGLTSQARAIAEGRRGFASLAARDLALKIIVSKGDRAIDELMLFFGDEARFARAHGGDALVRIEGADHNLTPPQARRAAAAAFDALIAKIAPPAAD